MMPTLREFLDFIIEATAEQGGFTEQVAAVVELEARKRFPSERIYITPASSRKDPSRREAIAAAARKLPTGIVSERLGISRQLVAYHLKKSKNPDG
jgi:DNA-binding transcriptional regulator LsrR (DeoR family)